MATIKSFSDLQQSKRLADILPLESADMWYHGHGSPLESEREYDSDAYPFHSMRSNWDKPCWSLAALLDVLPYPHIEQNYKGKWTCRVELGNTTYLWEDSNPIDACVAMVKKLHGLNLL